MAQDRLHSNASAVALAIAVAVFLTLGFYAVRRQVSYWWTSLPVAAAVVSVRQFRRYRQSGSKSRRLNFFYERAVQRIQGHWIGKGVTGEEFDDPDHVYATDLHIVGDGSLFEMLCIARTSIGQRGLAEYLLKPSAPEETLFRQEAVRELRERTDLRERVALLGKFDVLESKWNTFEDWLNSPALSFPRSLRIPTAITSFLLAALVLMGFIGLIPWVQAASYAFPLLAFHAVVGIIFRRRVNEMTAWVRPVSVETQVFREGLRVLEGEHFRSVKLRGLVDQVRNGSGSVRKLERLLDTLYERQKNGFYVPSLVLLVGTQLCMGIERWRKQHAESLRSWLQAWAEFEALNALAAYAYENPDNAFPEFAEEVCFEARALGHPLLARDSCVANDVALNGKSRFCVVSGSNMSGKSTLLRAIGLSAVLASAGAPVRAAALRISGLRLFASLSIVDSLLNGRSRFLAEVDRLRRTIESAKSGPVLFLIDEIFSGTNSRDRRIAAEAVVRTLVERQAIGALSTHDLALCEIADGEDSAGRNVHMGSREGGGPLDFDYRLKPGATNEANALVIARMAGVPV
jgi:hypothetical protein